MVHLCRPRYLGDPPRCGRIAIGSGSVRLIWSRMVAPERLGIIAANSDGISLRKLAENRQGTNA